MDERWTWSIFLAGIIHRAWAVLSGRCFFADRGSGRYQEIRSVAYSLAISWQAYRTSGIPTLFENDYRRTA